jgi:4-amino-4-deoxy-L-arabinose transferase-like glycosyltransferase
MVSREVQLLGVLWLVLVAAALAARPAFPVDETRYLAVAWEMWQRGDFLVPHLNGVPYSHKPPLLFWLIHLGWAVFGVNDWWPRLLPALLALTAVMLTARLARRLWPGEPEIARLSAWLLFGSLAWVVYTVALLFDMLLVCSVLLGVVGLARAARTPDDTSGWTMVGAAVAIGLLAKGPVIWLHLLPLALAAPWWQEAVRGGASSGQAPGRASSWYGRLALAVGSGCLVALLWALAAAWRGGEDYARELLWGQTEGRLVHAFAHARPVYWYLLWLPFVLFPWSLWPTFWRALLGRRQQLSDPAPTQADWRLFAAWLVPPFVGLSLISGKQIHYLLPLLPAVCLLGARALKPPGPDTAPQPTVSIWPVAIAWFVAAGLLVGLGWVSPGLIPEHWPIGRDWRLWVAAAGLALIGAGLLGFDRWGVPRGQEAMARRVAAVAAASVLTVVLLHVTVIRAIVPYYDVRPAAHRLAEFERAGRPIAFLGKYHGQFHFAGRLRTIFTTLPNEQAVEDWAARHPDGVVVVYRDAAQSPAAASLSALPLVYSQHYLSGVLEIRARALPRAATHGSGLF